MTSRVGPYILFETLGEGSFGKVKIAVHVETGESVAVKILDKGLIQSSNMINNVRREIVIMKALRHPYIANMRQVLSSKNKLYIVMDLVTGGDMFDLLKERGALPEHMARMYFQQLIDGIEYCHSKGVFHRDLKPENLLITEGNKMLKISDFGLSTMISDFNLLHTQCGSPNYVAPEIIFDAVTGYDGAKVDAWSCGIILFALITGYLPFVKRDNRELFEAIRTQPVRYPPNFPEGVRPIVDALLDKNPDSRATVTDIKDFPWFQVDYVPAKGFTVADLAEEGHQHSMPREVQLEASALMAPAYHTQPPPPSPPYQQQQHHHHQIQQQQDQSVFGSAQENNTHTKKLLAHYEKLFNVDDSELYRNQSFLSMFQESPQNTKLLQECRQVSAAWYAILSDSLQNPNMDPPISEIEIYSFELMLKFWDKRAQQVFNQGYRGVYWWDVNYPLSPEDANNLNKLLRVLELSNRMEPDVQDFDSATDHSQLGTPTVAQAKATQDTQAASLSSSVAQAIQAQGLPTSQQQQQQQHGQASAPPSETVPDIPNPTSPPPNMADNISEASTSADIGTDTAAAIRNTTDEDGSGSTVAKLSQSVGDVDLNDRVDNKNNNDINNPVRDEDTDRSRTPAGKIGNTRLMVYSPTRSRSSLSDSSYEKPITPQSPLPNNDKEYSQSASPTPKEGSQHYASPPLSNDTSLGGDSTTSMVKVVKNFQNVKSEQHQNPDVKISSNTARRSGFLGEAKRKSGIFNKEKKSSGIFGDRKNRNSNVMTERKVNTADMYDKKKSTKVDGGKGSTTGAKVKRMFSSMRHVYLFESKLTVSKCISKMEEVLLENGANVETRVKDQKIKFEADILGSDHEPALMTISFAATDAKRTIMDFKRARNDRSKSDVGLLHDFAVLISEKFLKIEYMD